MKEGEFPARQQTPQATKAGPPWGLLQVWSARPLGARVHHAVIPVLVAVAVAMATGAGTGSSPTRTPAGGSRCTGTGPCTRRSTPVARMTRAGRPPTRECGATACTGRSTPAPRGHNSPSSSNQPLSWAPHPSSPFANAPPLDDLPPLVKPGGAGGGGGRGTAAEVHSVATFVYDLWVADITTEPRALALRRWAESTVFAWPRELRGVGRAGLLYAEQSCADALARHLAHLAATGKSSAALRGTISAIRMAEKLQLLRPTVCPIQWAIAAGAGRAYNSEPGQRICGTQPQHAASSL